MKKIKVLLVFFLGFLGISLKAQVNPTIQWVDRVSYDATISGASSGLDGNSRVYVTGIIYNSPGNADIAVRCMDSTGAVLWNFNYDNGGYDRPFKIKVDAFGNTFITGVSYDSGTKKDFITIKIDNAGNMVWINRFDLGFGADDEAHDLNIDANGDVYVIGTCVGSGGDKDAVTIKIDGSGGGTLWHHVFNPNGQNDEGVSLVLANNQADVIAAVNSYNTSTGYDIVAYQLNTSAGAIGWTSTINGSNNGNDQIKSMILSGANVVLTGMADNTGTGQDYMTAKLDASSGTFVYKNAYDFGSADIATALVRDSTGNTAVTGIVYNSSSSLYEYHTVLYDSTGTQLWVHKKETGCATLDADPAITCDTIAHHFYIAGQVNKTDRDVLVYQLTPSGNLGWEKAYNNPNSGNDAATSIVVNGIGVLFVSANASNSGSTFDITTLKIAQTPVYFPPDLGTPEINDENFVFQENRGQLLYTNLSPVASDEVGYYNRGTDPSTYYSNSKISFILFDHDSIQDTTVRVDLKFTGYNQYADVFHYEPVDMKKHYFTTSAQGITDVTSYKRLFIPEAYPNVDIHHYSNTSGLKTYFVFKTPGESMAGVRLKVDGANSTTVDGNGYLIASTDLGDINMGMLTAYQATFNPMTPTTPVLMPLTVSWLSLGSDMYRFNVSGYVPFWPVVVYVSKPGATAAPAAAPNGNLWWATFIGEQGDEQMMTNKVDAKDNFYLGGYTTAAHYPTSPGTYSSGPTAPSSTQYGIVNMFDKLGALQYGTYYGGLSTSCSNPASTQVLDLAVDSLYSIYLVGLTTTNNMPVQTKSGAIHFGSNSAGSGGQCQNAFVAKLKPLGNALDFSSYYGGLGPEKFNCARYWNGQIYLGGSSQSPTLSLVSPQPNTTQFTSGDGMYLHLDTVGAIKHSTKMHNPIVKGDVDKNGNFYMLSSVAPGTGTTAPIISPAASFYTSNFNGNWDWGLQRMTPNDSLNWSTFIGGSGTDNPTGISIRDSVMALCGSGSSLNFTFVVAPGDSGQTAYAGTPGSGWDIQMMKFNLKKGEILWSAYHGTLRSEQATGVALDKNYNMFVTGLISGGASTLLPTMLVSVPGYYNQNTYIDTDAMILGYSSDNKKKWGTYYGSLTSTVFPNLYYDQTTAISVNNNGKLFISGMTNAKRNTLPLVKWNNVCYWDSLVADQYPSGANDGFIAMFETSGVFPVGIKENSSVSASNSLLLYPNPNSGIFNIRFRETQYETVNISVMNVMGQKVFEQNNLKPESNEVGINLGELSKGIYLINISDRKSSRTIKFVLD